MTWKILNAAGYQAIWLASILGATRGSTMDGLLAAAAFVACVLAFGGKRDDDLRLIPLAMLVGLLVESAWIAMGWLHFATPWPLAWLAPAWMIGIWVSFALTLNHSLAFLKGRPGLAAALGALGGPLAYWSAAHGFGAVHFDASNAIVLSGVGIGWACIFPLLLLCAERGSRLRTVSP